MKMSVAYSTFPLALSGALSIKAMPLLAGSRGSTSPLARPITRS
jgi:hypothetical protein